MEKKVKRKYVHKNKQRTHTGLDIYEDYVTHLLNEKFKKMKFRSEENGKVIKISDKKAAKVLGCEMNHTIEFNQFQGFIAKFYNDEKPIVVA